MNGAWFLAGGLALVAAFPKLLGRTRAGDPIVSEADEPFTLRAIRVGAGGVALILAVFLFSHLKA